MPASDFFRDTIAGQFIRLATGSKFLKYPEERDASLYDKHISSEKSGNLARTGSTQPKKDPKQEKDQEGLQDPLQKTSSQSSSSTQVDDTEQPNDLVNVSSGVRVDPEKGRDGHVVDWYGDDDPEVMHLTLYIF
jgi:DHA1 family multidrug resistance protein-like MFS transporter